MRTRGDMLRFAIAYALIRARKVVRGLRQGLSEEERYAVADRAVDELKRYGDPWRLNEVQLEGRHGDYCPDDWCKPQTDHSAD
jgi:hypothetical protein